MRLRAACLVAAFALPVAAQSGGLESPLMLGSGARALAMGRAFSAIAAEADALFWNPAALADLSRGEFSLFHSPLYADEVGLSAAHLAYPTLDQGSFALGIHTLGVGSLELRDDRNALLGSFDERETHVLLGYGRRLRPHWSIGGALRIAQQRVHDSSGTGIGFDLAALWRRPFREHPEHELLAGANLQNLLEPSLRLVEDTVRDPRRLRIGVGYRGQRPSSQLNWTFSSDLEWVRDADAQLLAGMEFGYGQLLKLRAGLEDGDPAFGFGVESHGIRFDYAMRTHDELERNDRFTLSLQFGSDVPSRRLARQAAAEREVEALLSARLLDREEAAIARDLELAQQAFAGGDYDAARRHYRRVLALRPDHEAATKGLADTDYRQLFAEAQGALREQRFADAASGFMTVLVRWPDDQPASNGLNEARAQLQKAEDREAQLGALFRAAMDRFTDGDLPGAERDLRELLRLDPAHSLGLELLERVTALASERAAEHFARAERLRQQQRFDHALAELARAAVLRPDDRDWDELRRRWRAEEAQALAQAQAEAERRALTARQAETPVARKALDPVDEARLRKLFDEGLSRFEAGDFERAIANWQRVWNERRDFQSVSEYLVKAYLFEGIHLYSQGSYDAAIERCQRILEIEPQNAKAKRYLARIREEQQEVDALGDR